MAYVITFTDGQIYTVLGDGVVDSTLGISLIGQNFQNYGQLIANNFVHMLENFSNTVPPTSPIIGQLWWDSGNSQLNVYNGSTWVVLADNFSSNGLAEVYVSDVAYASGNVVVFGGTQDVTVSSTYCDQRIAGVVSPLAGMSDNLPIILTGKTLCNVVGPVTKGDILVNSTTVGCATKLSLNSQWIPGCVIGKSLVTDNGIVTRQLMISVGRF